MSISSKSFISSFSFVLMRMLSIVYRKYSIVCRQINIIHHWLNLWSPFSRDFLFKTANLISKPENESFNQKYFSFRLGICLPYPDPVKISAYSYLKFLQKSSHHPFKSSGTQPPLWVGVFRWRVKGRGRGEFFAEFLTNEKAAHH